LRCIRRDGSGTVFAQGVAVGERRNSPLRGTRRAIFSGRWKLIVWTDGDPELYDVAADPGESKNLYNAADPRAASLMAGVRKWIAAMPRTDASGLPKPVDKSTLEKLRSLGYVQ